MILRRWRVVAIVFSLVMAMALALSDYWLPPRYQAEAVLLVERSPMKIIDIDELRVDASSARDFFTTQIEIIKSRSLSAAVIEELELDIPIEVYRRQLGVEAPRNSRLITISFKTRDKDLAVRVANAHAAAFIERGHGLRAEASTTASAFLDESLAELKARLEESEATLNEYRQQTGIVSLSDDDELILDRIDSLARRVAEVRAERISEGALLRLARRDRRAALSQVEESSTVAELREELRALEEDQEAQALHTLPSPVLQARIEATRRHLREEVDRYLQGAEASQQAMVHLEKQLATELDASRSEALANKDASVQFVILAREVEANRELYAAVLQRRKEISMTEGIQPSNEFIIDEAIPPTGPSGLSRELKFMTIGGAALMLSLLVALTAALLDDTVESADDIESTLDLPCLGVVPLTRVAASDAPGPARIAARSEGGALAFRGDPDPHVTESYRAIRTSLLLSRPDEPPRTLLVTSSTHSEGKTSTALNLAASLAQPGAPVLIIDADLRRPRCHTVVGAEPGPGLGELLAGQIDLKSVVKKVRPDLYLLQASPETPPDPVALLGSSRMRELLSALTQRFRFVLVDAPPLLPVSDAVALSASVEGVVFVVGSRTSKQMARKARHKLDLAHAKVLGVVLNGFDLKMTGEAYTSIYYEA